MEILVSRSRLAGTPPHYVYRVLVPVDGVAAERRAMGGVSVAPRVAGRIACVRVAPVVAPERYLMMSPVERAALAPRIGALSRRIELLIIRSIFPEMTADSLPIIFELDHDPGDACVWIQIADLTAAFDRLESNLDILTAFDLGLRQGDNLRAA